MPYDTDVLSLELESTFRVCGFSAAIVTPLMRAILNFLECRMINTGWRSAVTLDVAGPLFPAGWSWVQTPSLILAVCIWEDLCCV